MKEFDVFENWRSPDGDKFKTDMKCDSCFEPTIAYAIIEDGIEDGKEIYMCKSCLWSAMESVNKRIRSKFENINRG